jgi:hypothetical protein
MASRARRDQSAERKGPRAAHREIEAASEKLIKANVLFRLAPAPWALYRKREERRMDTATSFGRRALRASSGK